MRMNRPILLLCISFMVSDVSARSTGSFCPQPLKEKIDCDDTGCVMYDMNNVEWKILGGLDKKKILWGSVQDNGVTMGGEGENEGKQLLQCHYTYQYEDDTGNKRAGEFSVEPHNYQYCLMPQVGTNYRLECEF